MMLKYNVRAMERRDIEGVRELERLCASENISSLAFTDAAHFIVAEADGKIIAYLGSNVFENECDITNILVNPDYRRRGVARAIMESLPYERITLDVRSENSAAIALYKSLGFVQNGLRRGYYENPADDALLFERIGGKPVIILAVESSCDETAVAISENGRKILSNVVLSQADMHALYGGVVPEIASRRHIESIAQLTKQALAQAGISQNRLDAVAVTYAPGLIGALLVGVGFAKAYAFSLGVPLIPVHHIRGHIAANYIAFPELEPPYMCLVVSGGHSLLVDVRDYTDFEILGSTRDDAAGEAFDKCARVMGLGYPGGAKIDELAKSGDDKKYKLPRSKIDNAPLDMSFSGLKTAVINTVHNTRDVDFPSLAASFSAAVSDTLVPRAISAAKAAGREKLAVAGGVAANSRLRADLALAARENNIRLYYPPLALCGDNGAMIATQAYYEFKCANLAKNDLNAYANMPVSDLRR